MLLKSRLIGKEITDDLSLKDPEVIENLKELEIVNRFLGGHSSSYYGIKILLPKVSQNVSIADYGCGGGDTLLYLKKKFNITYPIKWTGVDGSEDIVDFARKKFLQSPNVSIIHGNIFSEEINKKTFDIIHCSLTCHHFKDEQLISLFRQFYKNSSLGFIINDLHRHALALCGVKLLNGTIIKTKIGQHDGVQSVLRGFTKNELEYFLSKAGIKNFKIYWRWAFRWLVVVKK